MQVRIPKVENRHIRCQDAACLRCPCRRAVRLAGSENKAKIRVANTVLAGATFHQKPAAESIVASSYVEATPRFEVRKSAELT